MIEPHVTAGPICLAATGDRAGEGAVWHEAHQAVYWADINRFLVHRFTPRDGCVKTWFFEEPVTSLILTNLEHVLVVVFGSRVVLWEPSTGVLRETIFSLNGWPQVRLNDARADPRGSLWVGSMRNNVNPDGSEGEAGGEDGKLYRIDPDGTAQIFRQRIGISNTVAWSPDGRRFYFGDSLKNVIWAYDYEPATGAIANERPFLDGYSRGVPDGSTVDCAGYVWNCRWGGDCIVRVTPDGVVDRVIEMPVKNITTCTFGGPDLNTLYVTTAASGAPPSDRLAGGLFAIQTEVAGLPEKRFLLAN